MKWFGRIVLTAPIYVIFAATSFIGVIAAGLEDQWLRFFVELVRNSAVAVGICWAWGAGWIQGRAREQAMQTLREAAAESRDD